MARKRSVLAEAQAWATKRKLFGTQAFLRYIILRFTENLNQISDDFVFKGGNLLWIYIETPRATTDLNLVTLSSDSHEVVRALLEKACQIDPEIQFEILNFQKIEREGKTRAAVTFTYSTKEGASNRFEADIVYALESDTQEIDSPLGREKSIRAATLENIIADKLSACRRFGSGNTRVKDFDDLWRLSKKNPTINRKKLKTLLKSRDIKGRLEENWISAGMERNWKSHSVKYKDLPEDLETVFTEVNLWLKRLI